MTLTPDLLRALTHEWLRLREQQGNLTRDERRGIAGLCDYLLTIDYLSERVNGYALYAQDYPR